MTILAELLKSGNYKLPKDFFDEKSPYGIDYHMEDGGAASINVYRNGGDPGEEPVMRIELPEHYLQRMLMEYVHGSFNHLRRDTKFSSLYNTMIESMKELDSIPREVYTSIDNPKEKNADTDLDRPILDGDAPAMQPRGMVEPPLPGRPERRERRWQQHPGNAAFEFEQERVRNRWVATGRTRPIFLGGNRNAPVNPNVDVATARAAIQAAFDEAQRNTAQQLWTGQPPGNMEGRGE